MSTGAAAAQGDGPTAYGVERLVGLARRRLWLILCCATLAAGLGFLYAALQTPVYRATVELLVDPQALQVVGHDIVRPDTSASIDFANVDSQALVMVSTSVLRGVVERLHLVDDPAFQAHLGRLARLVGAEAPLLDAGQRAEEALDLLRQSIVVHRVDNSLVFQVTVSNPDARRSASIANALAQSYLKQVAIERVDAVGRSTASIVGQVSELRQQLDAAEAAAERFRAENGLIRSSDTGLVVTQQLKDLYTQIDAANADVARLASRRDQLAKSGPEALLTDTVPEALASATIVALRGQYAETARELASLGQTLLPQHPRIQEVKAELAETQRLLKAELVRIRSSVATSYAQAVDNLAKLHARAKDLTRDKVASSSAEIKLRQLESEAEAIRAVFNASLSRARELEQQGKIATSNSRVLSEAMPPLKASKPPLPIVVATAALFGACAGLGIAFLIDILPRRAAPRRSTPRGATGAAAAIEGSGRRRSTADPPRPASLDAVARDLQRRFCAALPAVVAVVGVPDAGPAGPIADALARMLADMGEDVLLCSGGPVDEMKVRHFEPRGPRANAQGLIAAARGLAGFRHPRASATVAGRGEFILVEADALAAPAGAVAVVLAADLAGTGPEGLAAAAARFDPGGRLVCAVVALDDLGAGPKRSFEVAA